MVDIPVVPTGDSGIQIRRNVAQLEGGGEEDEVEEEFSDEDRLV